MRCASHVLEEVILGERELPLQLAMLYLPSATLSVRVLAQSKPLDGCRRSSSKPYLAPVEARPEKGWMTS